MSLEPSDLRLHAPLLHVGRGHAVQRRRLDVQHPQHRVDLPAVVDLVLGHHPQPLPRRQARPFGRRAFGLQRLGRQRAKLRQRFLVQAIEELQDGVAAVGQLAPVRDVAAVAIVNGLGPDEAFGDGDVPDEVAERERARLVGPLDAILRDAGGDAPMDWLARPPGWDWRN